MFQGLDAYKGPYIKYVREEGGEVGGQRIFVGGGVMKYFRHILMGHEIFFKVFHGSQNFLMFYSRNFIF